MYANKPAMAKRWQAETPAGKLPARVKKMSGGGLMEVLRLLREELPTSIGKPAERRLEQIRAEVPRAGELYSPRDIAEGLSKPKEQAFGVMNPKHFEHLAYPIEESVASNWRHLNEGRIVPTSELPGDDRKTIEYLKTLISKQKTPFAEVPYFGLDNFNGEIGSHNGRHRMRALAELGHENALVDFRTPRIRTGNDTAAQRMARKTRDLYPQGGDDPIQWIDLFNGKPFKSGGVKMADGGPFIGGLSMLAKMLREAPDSVTKQRIERIADMVPGAEKMYSGNALTHALYSEPNKMKLAVYDPAKFEKLAWPMYPYGKDANPRSQKNIAELRKMVEEGHGFSDVPYLEFRERVRSPAERINSPETEEMFPWPKVANHEGRHRSRAMAQAGRENALMRIYQADTSARPENKDALTFHSLQQMLQPQGDWRKPVLASDVFKTEPFAAGGLAQFIEEAIRGKAKWKTDEAAPFYRVAREGVAPTEGIVEKDSGPFRRSGSGFGVRSAEEAKVRELVPTATPRKAADIYNRLSFGRGYEPDFASFAPSSSTKQRPIAQAFDRATKDDNYYPQAIFDAYKRKMPEMIDKHGIENYDDLVKKSYGALRGETDKQFASLPINMSYHHGAGQYQSSPEMLRDVVGNKHLYVYRGGDEHPALAGVDARTGLNPNEKFRAIHDYFGHATSGATFGPQGEEKAWLSHQDMMSPLARIAMGAETRGQNSFVNYSGINRKLIDSMKTVEHIKRAAIERGDDPSVYEKILRDMGGEWQYAGQKPVALPPEMLEPGYKGEMPDYLHKVMKKAKGGLNQLRPILKSRGYKP